MTGAASGGPGGVAGPNAGGPAGPGVATASYY